MYNHLIWALPASLVLFASVASAREADLLDFTAIPVSPAPAEAAQPLGPRLEGLGLNPFEALGAVQGGVGASMRDAFVQHGFPIGEADDGKKPALGVPLPRGFRQLGAERIARAETSQGFSLKGGVGSFAHCDRAAYIPTWWLSREVEGRRAYYFDMMAGVACEFGIPTTLLDAVIAQESGYKFWAISDAGAMGMMQIMPGTARLLGLRSPFEPLANLRAGARYLRQQLDRFGRIDLALAAYNAGPERASLRAGFVPRIPETMNYVATIFRNWSRLGDAGAELASNVDRGAIAAAVVRASGYRSVELSRYDGLNASNPM